MKLKEKALGAIRSQKSFAEDKENEAPKNIFTLSEQSKPISKKSIAKASSSARKPLINITNVIASEENKKDCINITDQKQELNKEIELNLNEKPLVNSLNTDAQNLKPKQPIEEEPTTNKKIVNFVRI